MAYLRIQIFPSLFLNFLIKKFTTSNLPVTFLSVENCMGYESVCTKSLASTGTRRKPSNQHQSVLVAKRIN